MPEVKSQRSRMLESGNRTIVTRDLASQGRAVRSGRELVYVREQLLRIAALDEAGFRAEARAASADLLFDFQPFIAAQPRLVSQCVDVLQRCGATALQQRFLLAVYGDTVTIPGPLTRAVDASCHAVQRPAPAAAARHSSKPELLPRVTAAPDLTGSIPAEKTHVEP